MQIKKITAHFKDIEIFTKYKIYSEEFIGNVFQ